MDAAPLNAEGRVTRHRPRTLSTAIAALISLLLGYDLGIVAAALDPLEAYFHLTNFQLEALVGLFTLVAAIATPICAFISDRYGRRCALIVSSLVATIGSIIMAIAPNYGLLLFGRAVAGLGVGGGISVAPTYLVEISPAGDRGMIVSMLEIFLNFGIFAGFLVGRLAKPLQPPDNFRIMFGGAALPAAALAILLPTMPESPRWLFRQGRKEEAREVLQNAVDAEEAISTLSEIEEEEQADAPSLASQVHTPWFLQAVGISLGLSLTFAYTGIDAVTYYSDFILSDAGLQDETFRATCLVLLGAVKSIAIMVPVVYFDRIGRRLLLMASTAGMCLASFALIVPGIAVKSWQACLAGILIFAAAFSIGLGPGFYLVTAELWPTQFRAKGVSVGQLSRSIHCGAVQIGFLTCARGIGYAPTFSIFGVFAFFGTWFIYAFVPETKEQTLEGIMATHGPRSTQQGANDGGTEPENVANMCRAEGDDGPESDRPPPSSSSS